MSTAAGLTFENVLNLHSYVPFREECQNQTEGYPNARYKRFTTQKAAEDFAHGTIISTPLPSKSDRNAAKGKKRAHAKIEDESCWDVVYSDGACKGNGKDGSVAGVGVWWGHEDPRSVTLCASLK